MAPERLWIVPTFIPDCTNATHPIRHWKTMQPSAPADRSGPAPFDRGLLQKRRGRAASGFGRASFLLDAVADELADRLADVTRSFDCALLLGAHTGTVGRLLAETGKVAEIISSDSVFAMAVEADAPRVVADEEALPFAEGAFDLIVSPLVLQWVNDLPGTLVQCLRCLRPDGLFLAALVGGASLQELREATLIAETEVTGGAAPRVAPFAEVRELGGLLQRAGFALPVTDTDRLTARYDDAFALMRDLKAMGASNAPSGDTRRLMSRDALVRTAQVYAERHSDPDGRVRATFEIVYLTGWAPHENQQKPLAPGSGQVRLADALGTTERPAGDKTTPRRK